MSKPDFSMFIRGHEYAVTGYKESGDPSVGLYGDYFIVERLVSLESGEEASQAFYDSLTEGEQLDIDSAAYDSEVENRLHLRYWKEDQLEAALEFYYQHGHWPEDYDEDEADYENDDDEVCEECGKSLDECECGGLDDDY